MKTIRPIHASALPPKELAVCFALSMVVLLAVEIEIYLVRRWGLYGLGEKKP